MALLPAGEDFGVLHTKSLQFGGRGIVVSVRPGGAGVVRVAGSVTFTSGILFVQVPGTPPAIGEQLTVIDNDGTDPVNGTFANLPEGSILSADSYAFSVSYRGGDGNDVVITRIPVATTTATLTQNAAVTTAQEPVTFTATITSTGGAPTGYVDFYVGNDRYVRTLQNGSATLTISSLTPGTYVVVVHYPGAPGLGGSVSDWIIHNVTRIPTSAAISSSALAITYCQTVRFTVNVGAQAPPGYQPTGIVTVNADGVAVGTGAINGGSTTVNREHIHAGSRMITAVYGGDALFDGSTSAPLTLTVAKAVTALDPRPHAPMFIGAPSTLPVAVNAVGSAATVTLGAVTVSEGDKVLATQNVDGNGLANTSLPPLAAGHHILLLSYGGEEDFEPASSAIDVNVTAPRLAVHGAQVTEGNSGTTTALVMITLSEATPAAVRVSFTTLAGSATEGIDYQAAGGVVEFAPGEQSRAIEIRVLGDLDPEADETFSVILSDPVNAVIDASAALVVIENDDAAPPRRRAARH